MAKKLVYIVLFFIHFVLVAQEKDSLQIKEVPAVLSKKALKKQIRLERREARELRNIRPYNALAPSKAAFYSAILPGLGQAYTGKYWKIPLVYGALGTSIGIALWNDRQYNKFRAIFQDRLRGITTDEFFDQENNRALVTNDGLIQGQRQAQKNKDLSILISTVLYVLNIVDANVTAHLQQYNLNESLSLSPQMYNDALTGAPKMGLALQYNF